MHCFAQAVQRPRGSCGHVCCCHRRPPGFGHGHQLHLRFRGLLSSGEDCSGGHEVLRSQVPVIATLNSMSMFPETMLVCFLYEYEKKEIQYVQGSLGTPYAVDMRIFVKICKNEGPSRVKLDHFFIVSGIPVPNHSWGFFFSLERLFVAFLRTVSTHIGNRCIISMSIKVDDKMARKNTLPYHRSKIVRVT